MKAEKLEDKLAGRDSYKKSAFTVFRDKIYLGDGRENRLLPKDVMVHLPAWHKAQIYGASGDVSKMDNLKIFGDKYFEMYGDYKKIQKILEDYPYITAQDIVVRGAAGEEAITNHETIRKLGKLSTDISGQQRILEDLNAFNIAKTETTDRFKHEYLRKTSAVLSANVEIADDVLPGDVRSVFAVGEHELFADATSYRTSLRDKELKIDVAAEIAKEIPGMFAQTQEDKVIALVNALSGTNQGDWSATTGNFYDVRAAEQIDEAIAAVKPFGGELVVLMNSDTWRLYMDNLGSAFDGKAGNVTTEAAAALTGTLVGNPQVRYYINDSLTPQSYVLAAKNSYMKHIQGMIIKTSFKDVRTAGQMETTFEFNYNGFFENEVSAVFRAITVGA